MSSFSSTDDVRDEGPLPHLQTVQFEGPIELEQGGRLPNVRCAFETWGSLNARGTNAVLICHAMSGDSHAASHDASDSPGWWERLIGPGKAVDTDRFYVVCPNILGGCRGSTGPGDPMPGGDDDRPFGADFPTITIADMVDLQHRLAKHLGIKKWRAIIGGSLGGHQALCWVTRYPNSAQTCIAIATSPRLTSQALGFDVVARNAIQTDPYFAGGQYYDKAESPDTGLAIARMLGHITYLSTAAMEDKFAVDRHDPRKIASAFEQKFSIGSYLAHQGQKFTDRFDANSYVTLSMAMDLFDLGSCRAELMESFRQSMCDFLVVSFSSDWLFPPDQSCDMVNALTALDKPVTYAEIPTVAGHDAFLIDADIDQYAPLVSACLTDAPIPAKPISDTQQLILDLIPPEASVLDLGCGDGEFLSALHARGNERIVGVEVAQDGIHAAAALGLNVIDHDLNRGLPAFTDQQFDYVVLSETLQIVANIESLLEEMLRVGKQTIISFHNFAHRALRSDYVERGRSPKATGTYGFDWYNTPNRRFPSILDVEDLCHTKDAEITKAIYLDSRRRKFVAAEDEPNLNADLAIFVLSR